MSEYSDDDTNFYDEPVAPLDESNPFHPRNLRPEIPFMSKRFRYGRRSDEALIISLPWWLETGSIYFDPSGSHRVPAPGGWYVRVLIRKLAWVTTITTWRICDVRSLWTPERVYEKMFIHARNSGEMIVEVLEQAKARAARDAREAADFRLKWGLP